MGARHGRGPRRPHGRERGDVTPEDAEWVRENAWTGAMRKTFREVPGFYLTCACQWGGPCLNDTRHPDRHERCHVGTHSLADYETIISPRGGIGTLAFREPYRYPTPSATGWRRSTVAMVWLATHRCAWRCRCDCGHPRTDIAHAPERNPMRPIRYELVELPLFDLAT